MKNKYVNFVSDEHFLKCVGNLHASYVKAKEKISKQKFYINKIDTIKLTFDAKFNKIDEESIIETEILRQIDKSINNAIGCKFWLKVVLSSIGKATSMGKNTVIAGYLKFQEISFTRS